MFNFHLTQDIQYIKVVLMSILFSGFARAAIPQLTDVKVSGYFDSSYNYLQNSNSFTSGTFNRTFDINERGFTLQQVGITTAYQPKQGFGGLLNVVGGRDIYTVAPYGWNPDSHRTFGFIVPQGYLQYAVDKFTVMGGNFVELAGAEYLYSKDNAHFSHSILYGYAEPVTVSGLRTLYIPNDKFRLYLGVNNGWDNVRDTARHKTIEVSMSYMFNPMFSLSACGYSGEQRIVDRTSSGPTSQRSLIDLIATVNATKELTFVINYDYGTQTKAVLTNGTTARAVWQGVAGFANYKFTEQWRVAFRGEIFHDEDGYKTGVVQDWREVTATLGHIPLKNWELRAEARHDFFNKKSILKKNSVSSSNSQQSYALEAIYSFSL
jgi:hypothetical protein